MIIPRRKIYFIGATLILAIIVMFFVIKPTSETIKDISAEIGTQREELEKLYLRGQFLKPAKEQYEKAKLQIPNLSKIFVASGEELQIITALEQIADRNSMDQEIILKETEIKKDEPTKSYQAIPITLKIIGDYQNFISYLIDLESLNYYINIDDFKIFASGGGNVVVINKQRSKNDVSVLMNGNIYRKNN